MLFMFDDSVDCIEDVCDEESDQVIYQVVYINCIDNDLCDGIEYCDVV